MTSRSKSTDSKTRGNFWRKDNAVNAISLLIGVIGIIVGIAGNLRDRHSTRDFDRDILVASTLATSDKLNNEQFTKSMNLLAKAVEENGQYGRVRQVFSSAKAVEQVRNTSIKKLDSLYETLTHDSRSFEIEFIPKSHVEGKKAEELATDAFEVMKEFYRTTSLAIEDYNDISRDGHRKIHDYLSNKEHFSTVFFPDDKLLTLRTGVQRLISDINITSLATVNSLSALIGTAAITFDVFQPVITLNDSVYTVGEVLQLSISSGKNEPPGMEVVVANERLPKNAHGIFEYRRRVGRAGIFELPVLITFTTPEGKEESISRLVSYKVLRHKPHVTADTVSVVKQEPLKTATLGWAYPVNIKRYESKSVNVFLSVNNPASEIQKFIKNEILSQQQIIEQSDTMNVSTERIRYYEYVTVALLDPEKKFTLTAVHDNDRQKVDSIAGNKWRWNIFTTTEAPTATLILTIKAEGPGQLLVDKNIIVHVQIGQTNFFRRMWIFATENPGVTFTTLLVPLIIFVARRVYNRARNKSNGAAGARVKRRLRP